MFQINMAGWIIRHGQAAWRVNTPRDKVISDKVHWSCLMGVGAAATPCWTSTTSFCCRRSQKKWSKYWRHAAYISLAAVLVHTAGGWGWGVFTVLLIDHLLCSFTISFSLSLSPMVLWFQDARAQMLRMSRRPRAPHNVLTTQPTH